MRLFLLMACVVVALSMQGCAGTDSIISHNGRQSLQSLQLFSADKSPRFTFYLACTGADASCNTADTAFSDWAIDRHVNLHLVGPGDPLFTSGIPSFERGADLPYRVAVHFVPLVVPSFNEITFDFKNTLGSYLPPKVGYSATIYVFDSATGKLLQELPAREQRDATAHDHANRYIRSEVNTFVASLDPFSQP